MSALDIFDYLSNQKVFKNEKSENVEDLLKQHEIVVTEKTETFIVRSLGQKNKIKIMNTESTTTTNYMYKNKQFFHVE